jgi:ElaB/YqjD/DUF883 family membrane-anchored ribosome-binding protein
MRGKEEGLPSKTQPVQAEAEARELAKQVENLRKDLADLASTVRALAQAGSASAQRSLRDTTDQLTKRGQDLAEEARTAGQQAVEYGSEIFKDKYGEFETTVRRHPATAIAVALGIGYLMGLLSRNRS